MPAPHVSPVTLLTTPTPFPAPAHPEQFWIKGAPSFMHTTDEILVGTPTIFQEVARLIGSHGGDQASLRTLTPWDGVKMPVMTHAIGGLNLNGNGARDFLLIRSFEIYANPDAEADLHRTISFLIKVPGNADSQDRDSPTPDMIKQGAILAVATHPGASYPLTDFSFGLKNGSDSQHDALFRYFDPQTGQFKDALLSGLTPPQTIEEQYAQDRTLFDAVFDILAYVLNGIGYFDVLKGAEFDKGSQAAEAANKAVTEFIHLMNASFMRLTERYDAISQNLHLRDYYSRKDADLLPFMKAIAIFAKKELLLDKEDNDKITELSSHAEKLMTQGLDKFRWQGKTMSRSEFYQTLRETEDPEKRRQLVEAYSKVVLAAHHEGLFPMLEVLNAIAQKYGYANFAEYKGDVMHGITPAQFDQKVKDYHAANEEKIKNFIRELEGLNDGKTVYEWDVHYLADQLARKKLGGREIPKLKFSDALAAAKGFFRDMGIDLDAPPFQDNVFFDTSKRENKYGNAFAAAIGDGRQAWFNTNFDPTEEISLEDLGTIVHELVHDIHIIQSAQRADGSVAMAISGNPNIWIEGIAVAVDRLVTTQAFLDRYLAHLPQFADPATRKAIAEANEGLAIYDQLLIMGRARFEINLYETKAEDGDERTLQERLNFWPEWVRQYMHVGAMPGDKGGRIYATPHFAGSPGYYVSYTGGFQTALKATRSLCAGLENNDDSLMQEGGAMLLHLFDMGARLTNIEEIDQEIDRE